MGGDGEGGGGGRGRRSAQGVRVSFRGVLGLAVGQVGLSGASCRGRSDHEGTIPRGGWLANAEVASGDNTLSPRG
jgi:hypothetical protein